MAYSELGRRQIIQRLESFVLQSTSFRWMFCKYAIIEVSQKSYGVTSSTA